MKTGKTTIATNLLGRIVRPSTELAMYWPWASRFKATTDEVLLPENRIPGPPGSHLWGNLVEGSHRKEILAERAKVVAVRVHEGDVKLTLEAADGSIGECYAQSIALVPEGER